MSNISLKHFVDINIYPHRIFENISTRDTVVLYSKESVVTEDKIFSNLSEVTYDQSSNTYKYLKVYFDNGGLKVKVIHGKDSSDLTKDDLKALDNNYICVISVTSTDNIESNYTQMKTLAQQMEIDNDVYGINEKLLLVATHANTPDTSIVKNFAVKYSLDVGAEMTIAAYLSQIDINSINSIKDYAFTEEVLTPEEVTDSLFDLVENANMNIDIKLSNIVRNLGGNCKDGEDVTNTYVRIMLQQTLTNSLINLLAQKINSSEGVSKMYAVISNELEKYKRAGYLTTDKVWTDSSWMINYDNNIYKIINKGDALINGYVIKILPSTVLSTQDLQAHKAPPIYLVIADQYGIRKITINGQVI